MQFLKSKAALGGLAGIVALSVAGTTAGYAAMNKDISLTLDGKQQEVTTTGDTVREALAAEGIEIGKHDRVAPGLDEEVSDGTAITVRFGRPFNVEVDGDERTYWVTATTVDGALDEIGRAFDGADLSTSRSATVSRDGADLEVITPKKVRVQVAGKKPVQRNIVALTVGDVLDEMGVKVHRTDEVKPGLKAEVDDGDKIVFTDIRLVDKRVKAEGIDFDTVQRTDDDMLEGETEVTREGRAGARDVTYRLRYVNGKLELTRVLKSKVVREPVNRVVTVGTKEPAPEPAPEPAAPAANYASGGTVWDSLAQCESGGNWAINTGNGYYGGLQFSLSTWRAYGGPGYPHQQSRETQIAIAEKLRAATGGYGSWPHCSQSLGLPQ